MVAIGPQARDQEGERAGIERQSERLRDVDAVCDRNLRADAEGKGEEGGADVCSDASDDDLGFVCRADSGLEISVVPGAGDVLAECAAMDVFSSGWVIEEVIEAGMAYLTSP